MMRWLASLVFAFSLLALSSAGALAHAYLVESSPADGDLVKQAPQALEVLFNEPVELVTASLVGPSGEVSRLTVEGGKHARVRIAMPPDLSEGSHLVSYRVVSDDGHVVSGSVVFSIGRVSGGRPSVLEDPTIIVSALSPPLVMARFLLLAGMAFGVGALLFSAILAPVVAARGRVVSALAIAGVATFVSVGLQGADAHGQGLAALNDRAMWRSGLRLPQGVGALIALAGLAAAAVGLFANARAARPLSLIALALCALSLAWAGHARGWRPEGVMQGLAMLHVMSAICWAGALLPLAAASAREGFPDVLQRFSAFAAPVYLALLASGVALAATQFFAPREVFATAWGMALAAKLAVVAVVTLFAILNRTLFTSAVVEGDASALKLLRRSIRLEAAFALAIFAAASVWRITPPPTSLGAPNERAFQIHIHGAQAMASMTIRPARVGPVQIRIEPKAIDLSPLRVQEIDLFLTPDAPDVAPIQRKARLVSSPNVWEVEGVTVPAPGLWRIRVDLLIDDFDRTRLDAVISLRP
ncbi:MAG: copper resistance protein CopC [Beijerinckiaceae bacterium]|nr:copper resistance protein CopC [Beijerinckiaceae bacterium]